MPLPEALQALGERVPLLDARFFVTAVLTQREAGGNLAEVLDNLASVIRERFKVKRQVRVITAHGAHHRLGPGAPAAFAWRGADDAGARAHAASCATIRWASR